MKKDYIDKIVKELSRDNPNFENVATLLHKMRVSFGQGEMVSSLIMAQDFEDIKNDLVGDLPTNGEIIVGENQLKMWE